ncbi:MAG TPA: DUF1269 domain-containing protein [Microlunatus sp.]|jgi:uncharacterized membrane protein|nr:DUF1269 domain-containing protein [Microlunatus sp.]
MAEEPLDLYIAAYDDPDAAEQDWASIKQLEKDKIISVEALVLVNRADDGKIHIKDNAHSVGAGAVIGGVGGAIVGLIFPPALLASAAVGAGIGAGAGAAVKQLEKHQVKADIERTLPPGSSGIIVLLEERWVTDVGGALPRAVKSEQHHAHGAS